MKLVIGLDPDVEAIGVARLNFDSKVEMLSNSSFAQLVIDFFPRLLIEGEVIIYVESVSHTSHNWHQRHCNSVNKANALGRDLGRCSEVQTKIFECARHLGLLIEEVRPLRKIWKGRDGKITHAEVKSIVENAGWGFSYSRTNQEQRDAFLIAWNKANLPIRVTV